MLDKTLPFLWPLSTEPTKWWEDVCLMLVVFSCFVLLLTIYLSPGAVLPTDELLADNQFFISNNFKYFK
jgi:hypothetical protein